MPAHLEQHIVISIQMAERQAASFKPLAEFFCWGFVAVGSGEFMTIGINITLPRDLL